MEHLTLATDLYELTMMYGYFKAGRADKSAVFDMFYRENPCQGGYAIAAGLEQAIEYISNLQFSEEDLRYLRSLKFFDAEFLDYLKGLRFTGDVWAIPEGTVVFPYEPLVRVQAPLAQAQLLETALLSIINHQTLIATKASRVAHAAEGQPVMEFGLRRAQGPDSGLYGARAAIIGGCAATSNVLAGQRFGVPVAGTHAHSWIMSFPSELEAFRAYARLYPQNCVLLVDTYDALRSGIPNAITVAREMRAAGHELAGIRFDSGDLAYLSKKARQMLDEAGFPQVKIVASGDLDELLIRDLRAQGAKIDSWGVGTRLIVSADCPSLGGVYKLCAEEDGGGMVPKIKVTENPAKITNPGIKKVVRLVDKRNGMALADLIMLEHETIDPSQPLTIFDPVNTWKRKTLTNYEVHELLQPVFRHGERVYQGPDSVLAIQAYAQKSLSQFWPEYRRLIHPQTYIVDLSYELWNLKRKLIEEFHPSGNGTAGAEGGVPPAGVPLQGGAPS